METRGRQGTAVRSIRRTARTEFLVNDRPVDGAQRPIVAVDATGRALVAWFNGAGVGAEPGVFGR